MFKKYNIEIGLFILSAIFFYLIQTFVSTDIPAHSNYVTQTIQGTRSVPGNFLYYLFVFLLGFGKISFFPFSSSVLLALAVTFKYIISKHIISKICTNNEFVLRWVSYLSLAPLLIAALPSIFFFVKGYFVLYSLPVNTWHNSTSIFLMPFAILLFWKSYQQIENYDRKNLLIITLLIVINIFIKPSYVFVFIAAYPLALLNRYKFKKHFWLSILPIVFAIILVAIEYYLIYKFKRKEGGGVSVVLSPFYYQKLIFHNSWILAIGGLFVSMFTVYLFPALFLITKGIKINLLLKYSMLTAAFGIIVYIFFAEVGRSKWDGNFLWQVIVCNYIFLLVSFASMLNSLNRVDIPVFRKKIWIGCYTLYLIYGIAFLIKIFVSGDCH